MGELQNEQLEYSELMENYRMYFQSVAKGAGIYLLIIGACLSLPYTLELEPDLLNSFKEGCKIFAISVSLGGIVSYVVASVAFLKMHIRLKAIAQNLKIQKPATWLLPFIVWLACVAGIILLYMIAKYV